jgi:formylglycine-generating enzyme required for sulfatase activity
MTNPNWMIVLLTVTGCVEVELGEEDAADADFVEGKADGFAHSGAELAGAVRIANVATASELRAAGLTKRAATNIVGARPIAGVAALDAVPYIGPASLARLVDAAVARGFTSGDMVEITAGTFTMGHPDGHRFEPLHEVTLSTYWIDRFEVSQGEWNECVAAGVCSRKRLDHLFGAGYETLQDHPVDGVSHYEAELFCRWRGKRLPSEAMWERAARGDDDLRIRPWGDDPVTCDRANVAACTPKWTQARPWVSGSHPLGASPFGVHDLIGNVSEWVSDRYNEFEPTCSEPCVNPEGIPASEQRDNYFGHRGASLWSIPGTGGFELHARLSSNTGLGVRCALQ